jgi:hypothetical protein
VLEDLAQLEKANGVSVPISTASRLRAVDKARDNNGCNECNGKQVRFEVDRATTSFLRAKSAPAVS